jgi:transcriptional regulator with XRE-family HTH domain
MTLGDKLRSLRVVEGSLRGLGRPMTQQETVQAMKREVGKNVSQAYLSQIESGARPHLTNTTQQLLAKFFRVYPGFLVDDPPGYARELQSELRVVDAKIDSWLYAGASQFTSDPELQRALIVVAEHDDSRRAILLLAEILRAPGLAERLADVLRPEAHSSASNSGAARRDPPDVKRLPVRGYLKN